MSVRERVREGLLQLISERLEGKSPTLMAETLGVGRVAIHRYRNQNMLMALDVFLIARKHLGITWKELDNIVREAQRGER